ncbi:MAG: pseudouridine synthase [Succinivibrionaceae bacterium]|nr:pseudouridine synthase [Succinivibrionaceae bacterium]
MRLDKCLTENLGCSRKEATRLIRAGLVTINDKVTKDSSYKLDDNDEVIFDGEKLTIGEKDYKVYYMMNKPKGYVSSNDDSLNPFIISLFQNEYKYKDLFCVGRLDIDTEGLLFVTNDGEWCHRLTSPKHHVSKVYEALLSKPCPEEAIKTFKEGVMLNGEKQPTKSANLTIISEKLVHLEITEGKYHQVKRMFAAIGNHVEELKRLSIGKVKLDENLAPGEFRELTIEELNLLKE